VPVIANTKYFFNAWAMSMNQYGNYAQLQFKIDDQVLLTPFQLPIGYSSNPPPPFVWHRFFSEYTPASTGNITIRIIDMQIIRSGNDFGVDDISFSQLSPYDYSASFTAGDATVCPGTPTNLTVMVTGGKGPILER